MKKTNKLVALIVAAMLLFSATTAFAATYVSDPVSPSIANPGGDEAQPESPEQALPTEEPGAAPEETTAPEETVAPEPVEVEAVIQTEEEGGSVNIRAAASMDAEIIGKLTSGMSVTTLGAEGDWTKIRADGVTGYVYSAFLRIPEPVEEAPAEEAAPVAAERAVRVSSTLSEVVNPGDTITMSCELIGFDGLTVQLQWQQNSGGGWRDVDGANGRSLSYTASQETVNSRWRVLATVVN